MSIESHLLIEEEEEEEIGNEHPAHHPPAPADELFDISTTVDPSYVISLIRKLLPPTMNAATTCDRVSGCDSATEGTNGSLISQPEDNLMENKHETMDITNQVGRSDNQEVHDGDSNDQKKHPDPSVGDDSWEEHGCILWDLATSRTHAELMVQNLVLEVILATLTVSQSPRVTEISLGIIGNLACHEVSRNQIASVKGLVEIIVEQLFIDDTPCLCEEFRLLTLCLQGNESITWAKALQPDNILSRVLWVVENTLNPQLIEKSVGFLLTISESEDEVKAILLPHLVKLGLPAILINLLAFEISKLSGDERLSERYPVVDIILRAIEALTVTDSYSQELCLSKKLIHLLATLIKLGDKIEVATSCVTATVLIANLLSDSSDLILEINQDLPFLQGLLDIFPFASDDLEARNAIWDIISRSLTHVEGNIQQYVSILSSKSDLIEEELLDHQLAATNKHQETSSTSIRTTAVSFVTILSYLSFSFFWVKTLYALKVFLKLKRIDCVVSQWLALKDGARSNQEYMVNERDLDRLKDCCCKYSNGSDSR